MNNITDKNMDMLKKKVMEMEMMMAMEIGSKINILVKNKTTIRHQNTKEDRNTKNKGKDSKKDKDTKGRGTFLQIKSSIENGHPTLSTKLLTKTIKIAVRIDAPKYVVIPRKCMINIIIQAHPSCLCGLIVFYQVKLPLSISR